MKSIPSLFCAFLLGTTALAAMPVASQAADIGPGEVALGLGVGAGILIGQQDDDRRHRRDNDDRRDDHRNDRDRRENGNGGGNGGNDRRDTRDDRGNGRDNGNYERRDNRAGAYGGGEQRDDRIGRAMDIGRSQGRVLNAWPQGGSLFMVRVDTPRGRVDIIVDVDSGRVVGER